MQFSQLNRKRNQNRILINFRPCVGLKTLDPQDLRYRPNYDNSVDTDDHLTSKGFNYHQGPVRIPLIHSLINSIQE
jgi:glycogen debranching enzyme